MLATRTISKTRKLYYNIIAKTIFYKKIRWLFTFTLAIFYAERSYYMSYTIITYLIGFYLLQMLIEYFTPKSI